MEYITHEEYSKIGGVLDSAAYTRYSVKATAIIRSATRGRLDKMNAIPEEVKHLYRDVVEYMYYNVKPEKGIASASQSQGGTSESETYVVKTSADIESDIDGMISDYLMNVRDDNGTPLLYRGCRV